ncbi:Protein of unknown function [Bacillus cereus]|nr:Protein of unknown function [Bacillus cereus]SCV18375.1 Protein of unknown function [Bacillus cereus]
MWLIIDQFRYKHLHSYY